MWPRQTDDVAAKVRAAGGVPDNQMVGDTEGAVQWLPVELTLESAKALSGALARAIAAAEIEESGRLRTGERSPALRYWLDARRHHRQSEEH